MFKIVLDAGHSLRTPGRQTTDGTPMKEWFLNDRVCDIFAELAKSYEIEILRVDDWDDGLDDVALMSRIDAANKWKANLYLSVHHNAFKQNVGNGVEVFHPFSNGSDLAKLMASKLSAYTGLYNRGAKTRQHPSKPQGTSYYAVNRETDMLGLLVEGGFMTHDGDIAVIESTKGAKEYARALFESVVEFYKIPRKSYVGLHGIMSKGQANAKEMAALVNNDNPKLNCTLEELATYFIEECAIEGVNHDYAWCQSLHETGHFAFGGDARPEWNNFAGLGVTGQKGADGIPLGNKFDTPRLGVRAQIQHLKAYASKDNLVGENVDERFHLVKRGSAPYVEWLGRDNNPVGAGWAVPGKGYGGKLLALYEKLMEIEIVEPIPKFRLLHRITVDADHKVTFKNFKKGMEIYVKED